VGGSFASRRNVVVGRLDSDKSLFCGGFGGRIWTERGGNILTLSGIIYPAGIAPREVDSFAPVWKIPVEAQSAEIRRMRRPAIVIALFVEEGSEKLKSGKRYCRGREGDDVQRAKGRKGQGALPPARSGSRSRRET